MSVPTPHDNHELMKLEYWVPVFVHNSRIVPVACLAIRLLLPRANITGTRCFFKCATWFSHADGACCCQGRLASLMPKLSATDITVDKWNGSAVKNALDDAAKEVRHS